ncbi:LOB domain-containing protein 25 [Sesamum alatum]|uniref:LOB domain-containing protein 25 n=1 Tax=Sesamum alatum TaxID=300844 RepID=A0AAE1Y9E2_9LAMI|nr:LOB domain-containing protein 25 [Sesamum alatum]
MASSSSYSNPPCAACKFLRRKCLSGCIFAPYFPPEEPTKFANVHKIFGASNVSKLLNEILPHQREDAVNSLAYEAEARLKDPVYGCVGAISVLQRQVLQLQKELDATNADLMRYTNLMLNNNNNNNHRRSFDGHNRVVGYGGSGSFDPNLGYPLPYYCPWSNGPPGENPESNGGDD